MSTATAPEHHLVVRSLDARRRAPPTRTIRGVSTEVPLGSAEGLGIECVDR